jgi:acyl-CoA synthetase (NDP forming)
MSSSGSSVQISGAETIPSYRYPESAAKVLSKTAAYAEWRSKPAAMVPWFEDIRADDAKQIVMDALKARGEGWLSTSEVHGILRAFGIRQAAGNLALTADEAAQISRTIGFPVALKLASPLVLHKTDVGGVRLNLPDEATVRRVFEEIKQDGMEGIFVQRMIQGGVELMIGVAPDPLFGRLIAFGLGGIHVEILADVRFRVAPLTDQDAKEMVHEIRGYRLLEGYRGHAPADIAAIEEILLRVSRLVEEVQEICELDLNPLFALPPGSGCIVADARFRVSMASQVLHVQRREEHRSNENLDGN